MRRRLGRVHEAGGEEQEYPDACALDAGVATEDEGFDDDVEKPRDGGEGAGKEDEGVDGALLVFEFGEERRQRDNVEEQVEEARMEEGVGCQAVCCRMRSA